MNEDVEVVHIDVTGRLPRGSIVQLRDGNQALIEDSSLNWETLEMGYMAEISTGFFIRNFKFFIPDPLIEGLAEIVDAELLEALP